LQLPLQLVGEELVQHGILPIDVTVKSDGNSARLEFSPNMFGQVLPGIQRLTHGVSNFYSVEEGGKLALIDAGVSGDWGLLDRAVSSLGNRLDDLQAVLLTHAHSDHTGFAERARATLHIPVWVESADVEVAKSGKQGKAERGVGTYLLHGHAWRTLFGLLAHGGARIVPILEVSAFADGQTIEVPGRPRVVHVPGHTPGSAALFLPQKRVLFTGDALVLRNPLTGRKGPQIMPSGLNQNSKQALDSLSRLEGLQADVLLPGHGEPWTQGASEAVQRARSAGVT
jgi:glyoxylase-like metal-dependent hydrolase (beta-lactamase superfamily II)